MDQYQFGVWSEVEVTMTGSTFIGVRPARSETFDELHLVISSSSATTWESPPTVSSPCRRRLQKAVYKIPEKAFPFDPKKKNVTLLGTGGTIASRLDYRTGAVIRPSRLASLRCRAGAG